MPLRHASVSVSFMPSGLWLHSSKVVELFTGHYTCGLTSPKICCLASRGFASHCLVWRSVPAAVWPETVPCGEYTWRFNGGLELGYCFTCPSVAQSAISPVGWFALTDKCWFSWHHLNFGNDTHFDILLWLLLCRYVPFSPVLWGLFLLLSGMHEIINHWIQLITNHVFSLLLDGTGVDN